MRKKVSSTGVMAGSLILALAAILVATSTVFHVAGHRGTAQPAAKTFASLPSVAQARISAALGSDLPSYQVRRASAKGTPLEVDNEKNTLRADFTSEGVAVHSGQAVWRLGFLGYGYGDDLRAGDTVSPQSISNRVEYRRGPLTEWYVNGPLGLEQGFTLAQPPNRTNSSPLTVALNLSGGPRASIDRGGTGLTLTAHSHPFLRYTGLVAYDADGKQLRAWLELQGGRLLLSADDGGARYPITIDPIVQLAELTASDGASYDYFGASIAISGNTVVTGAPTGTDLGGAAYVFVEPATGWANMTQTAKLTSTDSQRPGALGGSVAISGNTVVVGAPGVTVAGHVNQGAAYVYVEPPAGWKDMTETAELTAFDGDSDYYFGGAVAINNGTLVVGAPSTVVPGMADVFVEPSGGWQTTSMYNAKLTASDGKVYDIFGGSVSMSGNTILVGAQNNLAAYVFVRPPGGWKSMTQTAELTASGRPGGRIGGSVSISGNTVVSGAPTAGDPYNNVGAVYLFVEPAAGWVNMTPTAVLTASNGRYDTLLGQSVAISGNTVLAGASGGPNFTGAVYVFVKPKTGWMTMTETTEFTVAGAPYNAQVGYSLALSGSTLVAGAPYAGNQSQGAAYVFGELP